MKKSMKALLLCGMLGCLCYGGGDWLMQVLEDNRLRIITTIADGMSLRDYPDIKSDFWKEVYLFFFTGTFFVVMGRAGKLRKRFLAKITGRSIIDAEITPYPYPLEIRKLIALKDLVMVSIGTKNEKLARVIMPPERWTPAGENPDAHYRKVFDFLASKRFSAKTIYNVFWSANNWSCPDPIPESDTEIEYWYGAEEKSARKDNIAWAVKHFPQTKPVELQGLAHAELVMIHPNRFRSEAMRFLAD